jgi:hypothetical protein
MKSQAELSEFFKKIQSSIKKKDEFEDSKKHLLEFRKYLWEIYLYIFENVDRAGYFAMPLRNDKTIAYYLYHTNRIEDITSNTLISAKPQIFYEKDYQKRIGSPIHTTGNELSRDQIVDFSRSLNIEELKKYIEEVFTNTDELIARTTFAESKMKISEETRKTLIGLNSVSTDENAFWLVDYWCKKDRTGLFLMPFLRHQLMHLRGCLRNMEKL